MTDPYECPRCGGRTVTLACAEGRCARPVVSRRDADGKPVAWMVGLVDLDLGSFATVEALGSEAVEGPVGVGAPDEYSLQRLRDERDYHRRDAAYRKAFAVQVQDVLAAVAGALGVSLEQDLPELRAALLEAVAAREAERVALRERIAQQEAMIFAAGLFQGLVSAALTSPRATAARVPLEVLREHLRGHGWTRYGTSPVSVGVGVVEYWRGTESGVVALDTTCPVRLSTIEALALAEGRPVALVLAALLVEAETRAAPTAANATNDPTKGPPDAH